MYNTDQLDALDEEKAIKEKKKRWEERRWQK